MASALPSPMSTCSERIMVKEKKAALSPVVVERGGVGTGTRTLKVSANSDVWRKSHRGVIDGV